MLNAFAATRDGLASGRTLRRAGAIALLVLGALSAMPALAGGGEPAAQLAIQPPMPQASTAIEMQTARRSGVTSIWLVGGIRVHHRRIDSVRNQVVVTLAMSGGELLETAESRGMTRLAAAAMNQWANLAPTAAAQAGPTADIRIVAGAPVDGLQLRMVCDPRSLAAGMIALREMIASPTITPETLALARETLTADIRREELDERAQISRAVNEAMSKLPPDDPLARPLDARQIRGITPDQLREWITRHAKENGSTIEVAVVGDVGLGDAMSAVDSALGSLPMRPRPGPGVDTRLAAMARPPAAVDVTRSLPGLSKRAVVQSGCVAPDVVRLDDQRTLRAAGRLLVGRTRAMTGGSNGNGGDVSCVLWPVPISGMGTFLLSTQTAPANAEAMMAILDEQVARLCREPPTPEELASAVRPLIQTAKEFETDARYWSGVLARCTALGLEPDEIIAAADHYATLTPEAVSETMRRYAAPDGRIHMTLLPPS